MKTLFTIFASIIITGIAFAAPANDMFVNRIAISGNTGSITGSNVDASLETGEPQPGGTGTVWWTWTASSSGGCQIDTCGSDFDTYLAVYTGSSVGSLTVVAENNDSDCGADSKLCIETTAGQTYQIQVSGYWNADEGEVILNWQLGGTLSGWIFDYGSVYTNLDFLFAYDLSILSYKYVDIYSSYYRTNDLGCKIWKSEYTNDFPDGFSIEDKNNNKIVDKKTIDDIGTDTYIRDYNGKQFLFYDWGRKKLIVYNVKKGAFVKGGEQTIDNFSSAWFEGKEIYARIWHGSQYGLKVFDKNLKKEKWTVPLAEGWIEVIGKGLTCREVWTENNVKLTCIKKGKKVVSEHELTASLDSSLNYIVDQKGGVLYWTTKSGINSPLTYLDRKNRKVVDNKSMTDVGNVWDYHSFDGKILYVSKYANLKYTFYVYKLKGLSKLNQTDVIVQPNGWITYMSFGKKVYLIPAYYDLVPEYVDYYAAYVYDKKLKKEPWKGPYAEGRIRRIGKDTLVRYLSTTSGDTVTRVYKLFNKKGEIVIYTFIYNK